MCLYVHTCNTCILFIHPSVDGHVACFYILDIENDAARNIGVCVFFELVFSFSLNIYPEVEFMDNMIVLFLVFWEIPILFSMVTAPIYLSTYSVKVSLSSTSLPTFVICRLFDDSHFDGYDMMSHWGFHLHFSDDYWYRASPHVPVGHLYSSLEECLFRSFACFLNQVVCVFDIELYELFLFFWY